MLAYIGTNEVLVIGALLMFTGAPLALVVFLLTRKATTAPSHAREVADLREEVGRLRDQIAGSDAAKRHESDTSSGVSVPHEPVVAQRVGQR